MKEKHQTLPLLTNEFKSAILLVSEDILHVLLSYKFAQMMWLLIERFFSLHKYMVRCLYLKQNKMKPPFSISFSSKIRFEEKGRGLLLPTLKIQDHGHCGLWKGHMTPFHCLYLSKYRSLPLYGHVQCPYILQQLMYNKTYIRLVSLEVFWMVQYSCLCTNTQLRTNLNINFFL